MDASRRLLPGALPPDEAVETEASLSLDPSPRLVSSARDFVRDTAPTLSDETLDVLLLLTSELVTNAVIHPRTPLEVAVTVTASSVVVAVHDLDLSRPSQQPYADREGGWGLALVTALADEHQTQLHPEGGKTAWFRLSRGVAATVADGDAARSTSDREPRVEAEG